LARRLAKLVDAPFAKVEATKFTEVGYVGRDVESMVRDLVENAIQIVTKLKQEEVKPQAFDKAVKKLAKILKPGIMKKVSNPQQDSLFNMFQQMGIQNPGLEPEMKEEVTEEIAQSRRDIEAAMSHPEEYGIPKNFPSMEGWLHPGEYRIPKEGTDAKKIIEAMVSRTKADLQEAGVSGDQRTFEVLTKASIVELEAQPKDYVAVAGIINNRLNNPKGETNGLIQSDATVTYGLGVRSYHLTEEQKADKNNKYNTYANTGLPAGPIASPGLSSIKAVANPENNPYYYWVTVDLDSGETKYSKTYEEHQRYVEEYNQWCSNHKGRCS